MQTFTMQHGFRGQNHVIAVKRGYRIEGSTWFQEEKSPELVEEPQAEKGMLLADTDLFPKPHFTDVVIQGSVHAQGGEASELRAGIVINGVPRTIWVRGKRTLQWSAKGPSFSDPEPFSTMQLCWKNAYGGYDQIGETQAEKDEVEKWSKGFNKDMRNVSPAFYRRNPHGKGFFHNLGQQHEGQELPNLEWEHDVLTADRLNDGKPWFLKPMPANFGWVDYAQFPRSCFWGERMFQNNAQLMGSEALPEYAFGLTSADLLQTSSAQELANHPRIFNGSHIALQVPSMRGKVDLELYYLHPKNPHWKFSVPTGEPKGSIQVPGDRKNYNAPFKLSTLALFPDQNRAEMTWHAQVTTVYPTFPDKAEHVQAQVNW